MPTPVNGVPLKTELATINRYPKTVRLATQRTINKSLVSLRKMSAQYIRKTYVISSAKAKQPMRIVRSSIQPLQGNVNIRANVVGLRHFSPKKLTRSDEMSLRVKRSGRTRIKKAFFIRKGGVNVVFQRGTRDKGKLFRRFTGAISSMVITGVPTLHPQMRDRVEVIWERQVSFEFDKLHRRVRP